MNIDTLVQKYMQKEEEIATIASQINASAKRTAIMLIDLIGSTSLKETSRQDNWLIYIYRFISIISQYVIQSKGVLIKRIGDEVMVSFERAEDVEVFLQKLYADKQVTKDFHFKIG